METETIEKPILNYQFVYSINQKAIYEYLLSVNLSATVLNYNDINLISYLVCLTNNDKSTSKIFDGEKYYFVQNNFLRDNLIFFNVGKKRIGDRQIGNIISKLEKLGIIKRNKDSKYERYLKVNCFLIKNWNINDLKEMSASQKLQSFKPTLWQTIINEFGSNKDFDKWIKKFDLHIERDKQEKLIDIATSLNSYCETAFHNQRLRK